MKKKLLLVMVLTLCLLALVGCGKKIVLHCDVCGKELYYDADSDVTEDWLIVCEDCQKLVDN